MFPKSPKFRTIDTYKLWMKFNLVIYLAILLKQHSEFCRTSSPLPRYLNETVVLKKVNWDLGNENSQSSVSFPMIWTIFVRGALLYIQLQKPRLIWPNLLLDWTFWNSYLILFGCQTTCVASSNVRNTFLQENTLFQSLFKLGAFRKI